MQIGKNKDMFMGEMGRYFCAVRKFGFCVMSGNIILVLMVIPYVYAHGGFMPMALNFWFRKSSAAGLVGGEEWGVVVNFFPT